MPHTLRKQLLLVHQDASFVKHMIMFLEDRGYDVLTSVSAQGASQKAQSLDIDLIIIGEVLADSCGYEFCQKIKTSRRTEHIPVIMITESPDAQARIRGYHKGADDCLCRSFDKDEFFARIEVIWRRGNSLVKTQQEQRQQEVIRELRRIVERGMIEPHFQPIYYLKPFRLLGFEVLSRPSEGSFIKTADELFNSAIKHDMYYPLEMLCWERALDIITSCSRNEHVFFNCSPHIIEDSKFSATKDIFLKNRMPVHNVVLELTERSAIRQYDVFIDQMGRYREEGFSFAVDDVGGGYASLESIVATKPEIVKIDIHIVRNIHLDEVKRSIIKFIVAFCRENRIISIAEGIECREEMETLVELGVNAVQGYYFYRPTAQLNLRQMKDVCVEFS